MWVELQPVKTNENRPTSKQLKYVFDINLRENIEHLVECKKFDAANEAWGLFVARYLPALKRQIGTKIQPLFTTFKNSA